jgi:hypothetical protein
MAGYFSYFPKTLYTFDKNTENQQVVTNILARSAFLKEIAENAAAYYEYQVKDSDTPEIIADKLYGDVNRHWIVLLFNNILDPFYEFPMKQEVLESYIQKKYAQSLALSQTTIHHYELRITRVVSYGSTIMESNLDVYRVNQNQVDFTTGVTSVRTVPGTADTELTISTESVAFPDGTVQTLTNVVRAVSNYTYELNENEKRRTIRLLDVKYVSRVENEFRLLMQNV